MPPMSSPLSSPPSTPRSQLLSPSPSPPPSWSFQPLSPPLSPRSFQTLWHRRRRPVFFLHYLWRNERSVVYDPLFDRWHWRFVPRFPTNSSGSQLLITSDCFYDFRSCSLNDKVSSFHLFNPFSHSTTTIPRPTLQQWYLSLSLVFDDDDNYKVVVLTRFGSTIQIFHSRRGSWTTCAMPPTFNLPSIVNSLLFNGVLYILSVEPNRVSIVNLVTGDNWIARQLPLTTCKHLMVFEGRFFLAGFAVLQENASDIMSIQVWEIFPSEIARGRLVGVMPHQLLREFCQNCDVESHLVCSGGRIMCFFHFLSHRLVTYDLMSERWTMATPSPFSDDQDVVWLGLAVDPPPNSAGDMTIQAD